MAFAKGSDQSESTDQSSPLNSATQKNMNLYNSTKNQHFISQSEQRLNTSTPGRQVDQMRIYAYDIIDRETCSLQIVDNRGVKISNNLAYENIFTFDAFDRNQQGNFEELFQNYEKRCVYSSRRIYARLGKSMPLRRHLLRDLLLGKYLNLIRNPFSIRKMLNTFRELLSYQPTDEVAIKQFNAVVEGKKPQQEHICQKYGIQQNEYEEWLKTIFILLYPTPGVDGAKNMYERFVDGILGSEIHKSVFTFGLFTSGQNVLLSDRGFSIIDQPGNTDYTIEFNLCSKGFFAFSPVDLLKYKPNIKHNADRIFQRLASEISVSVYFDNKQLSNGYNSRTIYQAKSRVFCSNMISGTVFI